MADNTTLNSGSGGDTIASDDIGGVKHQRVKLSVGADGSASDAIPVSAGLDTTGAAVQAVGVVGQYDDASTSTVTENQFAPVRISSRRALLVEGVSSGTAVTVGDGGSTISVDDGGGALTVDGTVAVSGTVTVDLGANNDVTVTSGSITADTELPAAAALADNTANPTAPAVGAFGHVWDGATWDRTPGNATDGVTVNLGANNDVTVTGTVTANLAAGTNNIGDVDVLSVPSDPFGANADAAATAGGTGSIQAKLRLMTTQLDAIQTSVQLLDNAIAGNELQVDIVSGAGSGGTAATDDAAFTVASTSYTPVGGIVTSDSVDAGDGGAFAMLANRQQKVTLYDSSGNELAVGGGTQYTEDAAAAANPVGTVLNLIRDDARAGSLTTADGDNVAARGTNAGELYVKHVDAIPVTDNGGAITVDGTVTANLAAGTNNIGDVDVLTVNGVAPAFGSGARGATVQRVTIATDDVVPVTDNSGSLTVDAPVGTPVFVRLSDGATAISTLPVSLASVPSHAVTNAGTFAVQVDGAALTALQLIDNPVIVDDAAFTPATSSVMMAGFQADEASTDSVDEGDAGAARMTLDRKVITTPQPHTTGGLSIFRSLDLDESEEEVKGTAGQVYGMWVTNTATSTRFIKFYNATAANVTVGTTTPVLTWGIPGNSSDDVSAVFGSAMGIAFDTAITVAATTGVADNDTGAPAANDVIINVFYK